MENKVKDNKVKLPLMSKVHIYLPQEQVSIWIRSIQRIAYIELKLENSSLRLSPDILLLSLLEKEGVDSSKIEGTQTNYEEIFYDIEGINNNYSWEVRNLINLYKYTFLALKNEEIDYTIDDLKYLHKELYRKDVTGFKNSFDPSAIIKKIKPGKIINNDDIPNWIGPKAKDINHATLIPIKPSEKEKYLEDMFNEIRQMKDDNLIALTTLIKFHPFFEAVHPFADGNGRLGRLLLVNLFSYLRFSKYNWVFISDYWNKNKDEYISQLNKVQTTNNWDEWTSFFIKSLTETIKNTSWKIETIFTLYQKYSSHRLTNVEQKILKYFFKYPRINKKITIQNLINKHNVKPATAYRSFEKVASLINATKEDNYKFDELWEIIK